MSTIVDVVSHLLNFPEAIERLRIPLRSNESSKNKGNIPVNILDTPKEYIFHMVFLVYPNLTFSDVGGLGVGIGGIGGGLGGIGCGVGYGGGGPSVTTGGRSIGRY
ncbi:hypothetical protein BC332_25983 [Capsicum chinense]|nr:hypothetical protein BC332_25983 [Capsicum chinense]